MTEDRQSAIPGDLSEAEIESIKRQTQQALADMQRVEAARQQQKDSKRIRHEVASASASNG